MRIFSRLASATLLSALAFAGPLSSATATDYTLPLINNTGLDPSQFSIYAMGFSVKSELVLGPGGTFISQSGGTVSSYPVGTGAGQISQIVLDADTEFTGGRLYFFIVPAGSPAPSVVFSNQPANPPATPIYNIVEITVPPVVGGVPQPATIDTQTVDGFTFPLTITLNGNFNVPGQQYGQPIYTTGQTATVNRAAIFQAYNAFMAAEGSAGSLYLPMVYGAGTVAGQPAGILNPGAFLTTTDTLNEFLNLTSPLNTVFNPDLTTLFSSNTLRVQGAASGSGEVPVIDAQSYTGVSGNAVYPGTTVSLPALTFTGETDPSQVFSVFNPIGMAITNNDSGEAIEGTITTPMSGNPPVPTGPSVLTLSSAVSGLDPQMYVFGAGIGTTTGPPAEVEVQIVSVDTTNPNSPVITLNTQSLGNPGPNSQYRFSKLPYPQMFQTPGQMVFANNGVFADNTIQFAAGSGQATVLGSLENWIVSALNRGVALNPSALNPTGLGGTSTVWGNQMNWYPQGSVQNLFSLFMHIGAAGGEPIFVRPVNAASWPNARNQIMGSAYGFAFDENGGPVPPAPTGQPEVPSKFDQNVPPGATVQVTFGPWTASATPTPTPTPEPAPKVRVRGKKKIVTTAPQVKIKGTAAGAEVFIRYKIPANPKPNGRFVTKRVEIKPNGNWLFKFKPNERKTILRVYAEDSDGEKSSVTKIRVIDERF